MGTFPWDNVFYHISKKSKALNDLWNDYQTKRDQINLKADLLGNNIEQLQLLASYNSSLVLNVAIGNMTDDEYISFLLLHAEDKPVISSSVIATVLSSISYTIAGSVLVKGILYFKDFAVAGKPLAVAIARAAAQAENVAKFQSTFDTATETSIETTAELGDQEMTTMATSTLGEAHAAILDAMSSADEALLASMEGTLENLNSEVAAMVAASKLNKLKALGAGGAVIIAVAADMIIGAIDGASEQKKIDAATKRLAAALETVEGYLTKVDAALVLSSTKVTSGLTDFVNVITEMEKIIPASFEYKSLNVKDHSDASWGKWSEALKNAGDQYLIITRIRNEFKQYKANWLTDNPGETFAKADYLAWKTSFLAKLPPTSKITKAQMDTLIIYIAKNSPEISIYLN